MISQSPNVPLLYAGETWFHGIEFLLDAMGIYLIKQKLMYKVVL